MLHFYHFASNLSICRISELSCCNFFSMISTKMCEKPIYYEFCCENELSKLMLSIITQTFWSITLKYYHMSETLFNQKEKKTFR